MGSVISWLFGGGPSAAASLDPTDDRYYDIRMAAGMPTRAGVYVSAESSRKIAAVYRCVSILSNMLAMFPKGIFERLERGRRPAPEHPLDSLISFAPNKRQTAFEFWQLVCHHLVLRQNAFIQIVSGRPGQAWVGQLVPLHPDRVRGPEEMADGRLRYEYRRGDGEKVVMIGGIDIWHIRGLSDDGLRGLSMIDLASDSIGTSLAAERHAAGFFAHGVKVAGVLMSDKSLKPQIAEEMSDSFRRKWGGQDGTGGVPVLWEGMKFEPVSMSMKDAEFLESRKFSVNEIARWFGIPPHLVGDVERSTSWGSGLAEQNLAFLVFTLQPWIELIEQSVRFNLIIQSDRFYPKVNAGALLRMAPEKQATVFEKLITKGVLSPNECRELLERNPREGGDEYVNPAQNVARAASELPGSSPDDEPPPDGEGTDGEPSNALRLARARLGDILEEEGEGLTRLANRHGGATDKWKAAVRTFYGRLAKRISADGLCSSERAKEWCTARRDLVLENGGLFKLAANTSAADESLLEGFQC